MTGQERANFIRHISFEGEIDTYSDMPRFQIKQDFDMADVFQNIYDPSTDPAVACVCIAYDPWRDTAWNALEVEFGWTDDGYDVREYPISASEQEILAGKMNEYCQEQTGVTLWEFMLQHWPQYSSLPKVEQERSRLSPASGFDLMNFYAGLCVTHMVQDILERATPEEREKILAESQRAEVPENESQEGPSSFSGPSM